MARVTIKDVAQKAEVSITTVSRVLNDKVDEYMRKETKDRILQAIKELNFKPDKRAQSLRGLGTKIIGLVIPNRLNPYFEQLAAAVEQVCYKEGYGVLLCSSQNSIERESVYLDLLERQKVDAIILSTVGLKKGELNDLIERGTPIVLVDENVPGVNTPAIFANNYMGGCQATQYLIDLGHRRIAFITGSMNLLSSKDRLRGFCETLKKNDLEPDRKLIKEGDYTYESGYEAGKQLLRKSRDDFTAIFCSDDLMAFGVIQAIRKKSMKVPDDYSIVGFDDMYFSSISSPQLTTVAQPVKEMAFRAFVAVKEQINEGLFQEKKHQFLDTQLIVRESSRPLENR